VSAQHYADVDLTDPDWPTVTFVCTGGPDDHCRQWCAEGCEEYCLSFYKDPDEGGHRWADTGSCREMDWLDAVGWQDSGWVDEPDKGGEREVTTADLRPGCHRIVTEWTGDDYIWRYPAADAAEATP
jgi:hypothetical protein